MDSCQGAPQAWGGGLLWPLLWQNGSHSPFPKSSFGIVVLETLTGVGGRLQEGKWQALWGGWAICASNWTLDLLDNGRRMAFKRGLPDVLVWPRFPGVPPGLKVRPRQSELGSHLQNKLCGWTIEIACTFMSYLWGTTVIYSLPPLPTKYMVVLFIARILLAPSNQLQYIPTALSFDCFSATVWALSNKVTWEAGIFLATWARQYNFETQVLNFICSLVGAMSREQMFHWNYCQGVPWGFTFHTVR